jgi:hypothetical protein
MRAALASIAQMALMAAIVATLIYWPLGLVLALVLMWAGIPLEAFLTFGGAVHEFAGMAAYWVIVFVAALAYASFVFPWDVKQSFDQ